MEMCGPFLGVYVFIVRLFCLYTKVVSTLMISYTVIDFPPCFLHVLYLGQVLHFQNQGHRTDREDTLNYELNELL